MKVMTVVLRWVEHDPVFSSLMIGRVELAQISKGRATDYWFYTLFFCEKGERHCGSELSMSAAKARCEEHAQKVIA